MIWCDAFSSTGDYISMKGSITVMEGPTVALSSTSLRVGEPLTIEYTMPCAGRCQIRGLLDNGDNSATILSQLFIQDQDKYQPVKLVPQKPGNYIARVIFTLKPEGYNYKDPYAGYTSINVSFDKTFTVSNTSDSLLSLRGLSSIRYNYLAEDYDMLTYGEGLTDYGTCDVYINGALVADDVAEYDALWPAGTSYELRDIQPYPGFRYMGLNQGRLRGTVGSSETIVELSFEETGLTSEPVPFDDVSTEDYFLEAVRWALSEGVTTGTSATTFEPASTVTRSQAMTFLWRAMGEPAPTSTANPFRDVNPTTGSWYYNAVLWAVEQDITTGTSATTFEPNTTCSYAQILTFLYRLNYEPGKTGQGTWYDDALRWARSEYLLDNSPAAESSPNAGCPRADIVDYLYHNLGDGGTPQ